MASFRTSSPMWEMVSFALRFVSWPPEDETNRLPLTPNGTFSEGLDRKRARKPARLAGPGGAR